MLVVRPFAVRMAAMLTMASRPTLAAPAPATRHLVQHLALVGVERLLQLRRRIGHQRHVLGPTLGHFGAEARERRGVGVLTWALRSCAGHHRLARLPIRRPGILLRCLDLEPGSHAIEALLHALLHALAHLSAVGLGHLCGVRAEAAPPLALTAFVGERGCGACEQGGAEECDWVGAEAVTYYHPDLKATEGAAALLLSLGDTGLKLAHTPAFAFLSESERAEKLAQIAQSTGFSRKEVRVSGESGIAMLDEAESSASLTISEPPEGGAPNVLKPRAILGESMGAGGALQLVLAAEIARQKGGKVQVTLPGSLCAAYGASIESAE